MIRSWMVIGGVMLGLAFALGSVTTSRGRGWFRRLRRPDWLTFEKFIPVIWTTVFTCAAWSAYIIWEREPGTSRTWGLMAIYLLLEVVTLLYTPLMLGARRIRVGLWLGAAGLVVAIALFIMLLPLSRPAAWLLLPYLIWSPIGTYTTWEMMQLNPEEA